MTKALTLRQLHNRYPERTNIEALKAGRELPSYIRLIASLQKEFFATLRGVGNHETPSLSRFYAYLANAYGLDISSNDPEGSTIAITSGINPFNLIRFTLANSAENTPYNVYLCNIHGKALVFGAPDEVFRTQQLSTIPSQVLKNRDKYGFVTEILASDSEFLDIIEPVRTDVVCAAMELDFEQRYYGAIEHSENSSADTLLGFYETMTEPSSLPA